MASMLMLRLADCCWILLLQAQTPIRPQSISLVPTGIQLPLDVRVNGVSAMPNCSTPTSSSGGGGGSPGSFSSSVNPTPGMQTYAETWQLSASPCQTFTLSSLLGPSIAAPGIQPAVVNASSTALTVPLLLPAGSAVADLVVNIGGKNCSNVQLLHPANASAVGNASDALPAVEVKDSVESAGLYVLRCTAPELPAGKRLHFWILLRCNCPK
jgi:hypothetical protein